MILAPEFHRTESSAPGASERLFRCHKSAQKGEHQVHWCADSRHGSVQRGRVKSSGKKPGFEAVNIYFRKKGDVQWKIITVRKRKFPDYDEAPLAVANTPAVGEYIVIGVIADEEIGQTSEIREVVYAG